MGEVSSTRPRTSEIAYGKGWKKEDLVVVVVVAVVVEEKEEEEEEEEVVVVEEGFRLMRAATADFDEPAAPWGIGVKRQGGSAATERCSKKIHVHRVAFGSFWFLLPSFFFSVVVNGAFVI